MRIMFIAAFAAASLASAGCVSSAPRPFRSADFGAPLDATLQSRLEAIDRELGARFDIAEDQRACGVYDLTDGRLAMVRGDAMFYGASVPKIVILLAYFEKFPLARASLTPETRRELELMIKRSDNDLAAKYAREIGLDYLIELLRSPRYRFYDESSGGGLWCGKYYGVDKPRRGDPLHDHSHGATVRQCLRYFLMLDRGALVSESVSATMREIFAAPQLDFHIDNFVAGLRGRDLTLIRKNGEWEDWHLDVARVQHGKRTYLIAGMTHHPRGREYLAALAAAVDDELGGVPAPMPFSHKTISQYKREHFAGKSRIAATRESSSFTSEVVRPGVWFNEVLPSWNVKCPPGCGFTFELRVGRDAEGVWSPWLFVGEWGDVPASVARVVESERGKIEVDYFASEERFDVLDYRIISYDRRDDRQAAAFIEIDRVSFCVSDTTRAPLAVPRSPQQGPDDLLYSSRQLARRKLPVPPRSQKVEDAALAGRICSPTSLAMVLAYRDVDRPTLEVAQRAYDPIAGIYGNWPRNVQAAYSFGIPGFLKRFNDWRDVEAQIAAGQPLIISIRAAEGQLGGAPYKATDGHLLVITGFDESGGVLVNDPAAAESIERVYSRADLSKVWFENGRGTAYVLLPNAKD